jgi:hypothetical protein
LESIAKAKQSDGGPAVLARAGIEVIVKRHDEFLSAVRLRGK